MDGLNEVCNVVVFSLLVFGAQFDKRCYPDLTNTFSILYNKYLQKFNRQWFPNINLVPQWLT